MAELHLIGQIDCAFGFPEKSLSCAYGIKFGGAWRVIEGDISGHTQVDSPEFSDKSYFCHPIDVHFATKGLQGWPKLHLQVWHCDWLGRNELFGYGFCHVPTSPGYHKVEVAIWKPVGSVLENISTRFIGGGPHLKRPELVYSPSDRFCLQTKSMGYVLMNLNVILRNFDKYGVEN